jgi:hypothetical protein
MEREQVDYINRTDRQILEPGKRKGKQKAIVGNPSEWEGERLIRGA